jgi:hypothetical protein
MNYKIIIPLLSLIGIIASCKTNYKIQAYSLDRQLQFCDSCETRKVWAESNAKKSIILISDSTLNYSIIYGHIGSSTKIKYRISNDSLILEPKDIYGKELKTKKSNFSNVYLYSTDSLISLQNNERYYINKPKEKTDHFYIVYKNKVHRIKSQRSADRILRKIEPIDTNRLKILNKEIAKRKYGISKKYKTFKYE